MSSTTTLQRATKRLQSAVNEDLAEAAKSNSALVQYRAVIAARKQVQQAEAELAQIEDGLATAATEEWERINRRPHQVGAPQGTVGSIRTQE